MFGGRVYVGLSKEPGGVMRAMLQAPSQLDVTRAPFKSNAIHEPMEILPARVRWNSLGMTTKQHEATEMNTQGETVLVNP